MLPQINVEASAFHYWLLSANGEHIGKVSYFSEVLMQAEDKEILLLTLLLIQVMLATELSALVVSVWIVIDHYLF